MDITVALDWTPNTNHIGFYVAKAKGLYDAAGLNVRLLSPHCDGYKRTPASRVEDDTATFAITPSETVISSHTRPGPSAGKPKYVAVAVCNQKSTSAIVTLKSSGIDRPAKLDGTVYASYAARYEGRIVQRLIQADGGKGDYTESTPPMLGIWNTLLKGEAKSTWVFMGWEGVEAQLKGVELNSFFLEPFGIPYGPSPLVIAKPDTVSGPNAEKIRAFLKATSEGYKMAVADPAACADLFTDIASKENPDLPEKLDRDFVRDSVKWYADNKVLLDESGNWGRVSLDRFNKWLDWLHANNLLTTAMQSRTPDGKDLVSLDDLRQGKAGELIPRDSIKAESLFTNDLLP